MKANPNRALRSGFEDEVMEFLAPLGFERLGNAGSFARKTSGALLHLVEVHWDVGSSASVRVSTWHPVLHRTKAVSDVSLPVIRKESIGDRLGEGYVGSNLFFPCSTPEEVRESRKLVRKCLAEGAMPFLAAVSVAEDVVVAGAVSAPRSFDLGLATEMLKRATRSSQELAAGVLPRLPQQNALPDAGRFEVMSAKRWIAKAEGSPFLSELRKAGFDVLKSKAPEFSASLTFHRRRRGFTDMLHITLGNYGARSEVQCLAWIPQFNGLPGDFDLASSSNEFTPELTTAWWIGEKGLSDRQTVINFMDMDDFRGAISNLSVSFAKADQWLKRKSRLEDLFEFPKGAIEAAERLGAQGYREHLEEWRGAMLREAAGRYESH